MTNVLSFPEKNNAADKMGKPGPKEIGKSYMDGLLSYIEKSDRHNLRKMIRLLDGAAPWLDNVIATAYSVDSLEHARNMLQRAIHAQSFPDMAEKSELGRETLKTVRNIEFAATAYHEAMVAAKERKEQSNRT